MYKWPAKHSALMALDLDTRMGPPPNNVLEVMYHAVTLGDGMPGYGEPIRIREGERILFRVLNASGNMGISPALPGRRSQALALDGNPVPTRAAVDILMLDVAERADLIVEMNNPGIWTFFTATLPSSLSRTNFIDAGSKFNALAMRMDAIERGKQPNLALILSEPLHSNVCEPRLVPSAAYTLV
jgi:FtsP/CotA-like multicopper oxidase with cupredoxin domain